MHQLLEWKMKRRARQLAELLRPYLPPGGTLLDVGSGTGHNGQALLDLGVCRQVRPVDVVDMRVVGPPVERFDGETLPLADRSVDVVLLLHVLHYSAAPRTLLRECARVARGSLLVLQSTHEGRIAEGALRLNELAWGPLAWRIARGVGWIPADRFSLTPRGFFSEARMKALIQETGLSLRGRTARPWRFPGVCSDLWRIEGDSVEPQAGGSPGAST